MAQSRGSGSRLRVITQLNELRVNVQYQNKYVSVTQVYMKARTKPKHTINPYSLNTLTKLPRAHLLAHIKVVIHTHTQLIQSGKFPFQ